MNPMLLRVLLLLPVFIVLLIGVLSFFDGQENSVNIYHICGKKVGWYDAMFLDRVKDKSGCEKFAPMRVERQTQ